MGLNSLSDVQVESRSSVSASIPSDWRLNISLNSGVGHFTVLSVADEDNGNEFSFGGIHDVRGLQTIVNVVRDVD